MSKLRFAFNVFILFFLQNVVFANDLPAGCDSTSVCNPAATFFTDLFTFVADEDLREDQVEALCREGESLKTCKEYVDRCVASSVPDIHDFFRGSVQLLDICKTKTPKQIITRFRAMNACDKKVNASVATFNKCDSDLSDGLSQWVSVFEGSILSDGLQLQNFCCAFKRYIACDGTDHERICGRANAQPTSTIYAAYECEKKFPNCPS